MKLHIDQSWESKDKRNCLLKDINIDGNCFCNTLGRNNALKHQRSREIRFSVIEYEIGVEIPPFLSNHCSLMDRVEIVKVCQTSDKIELHKLFSVTVKLA